MSTESLTQDDLQRALDDDRHLGFGYASADVMAYGKRQRLDRAVVAVANELGLDYEGLFEWTNSKNGRWLVDEAHGRGVLTHDAVRKYLNPDVLAEIGVKV